MKPQLIIDNIIIKEDMEDIYNRNIDWKSLNNTTIYVSGAYGMLASYLVLFLCYISEYKDIRVKIIAQGRNVEKMKKRFGDLFYKEYFYYTDENICMELKCTENIDYIIHAAGSSNPNLYSIKPVEIIEPNVLGTYYLLQLAKVKKSKGFLLFSTGDVYGEVEDSLYIDEDTIAKVNQMDDHSCYSESQRMSETITYSFFKEYAVSTKIVRIGHTYGPTMDTENDPRVFSSFFKCLINDSDIEILSDGTSKRPFCYLADAIAAYFTVLLYGESGKAYNVCNNHEFLSISEFANIVAKQRDGVNVVYNKRNLSDEYVENVVNHDNLPSDKRLKELGFEYHYTTEEGIKRVYNYISNC